MPTPPETARCPSCGRPLEPESGACCNCPGPTRRPPGAEDAGKTVADERGRDPLEFAGPGSTGRYEDLGEFAQGGMGSIHALVDRDLCRQVAKKVLLYPRDPGLSARFVEEAQITGQLEHPSIVPVHEIGKDPDGALYFTMKLVRGRSLDQIFEALAERDRKTTGEFPLSRLLDVFLKVCDAVAYAHSKGVIHRDLKPENVMVGNFGEVQVMDWGLAKVRGRPESPDAPTTDTETGGRVTTVRADSGAGKTLSGRILGTPAFMPPEQAQGRLDEIDERTDVWALGGILYGILCLKDPHEGQGPEETIRKAAGGVVVPPRRRAPGRRIPRELEAVCRKAMAPQRAGRYPSAEALREDVRSYLDRRPVAAYRYSLPERLALWVQRHPAASVGASVAAVLLAAGAGAGSFFVQRAELAEMREAEALRKAAREKRRADVAEVGRTDAEEMLEKGRRISQVLRAADRDLGRILRDLKASYVSPAPLSKKRALGDRLWPEVETFCGRVDGDPASQASMLAAKGWLRRLAGYEEEAFDLFRRSREADPDVACGTLFEGMVGLSDYIAGEPLPQVRMGHAGITFGEAVAETGERAKARKRFENALEQVRLARVWGESASRDYEEVLEGLRAIRRGDWAAAEKGLSLALSLPETIWMKEEMFLARAKVRYLARDLEGAIRDAEEFRRALPESSDGLYFLAQFLSARGLTESGKGGDASASFLDCLRRYDELLEARPGFGPGYASRGIARLCLAEFEEKRGADPREWLRRAVEDFSEALRREKGFFAAVNNRGNAWKKFGAWESSRGQDPRESLGKAIEDYGRCLELMPGFGPALVNRGNARVSLASFEASQGRDPRPAAEAAVKDFEEELGRDPDDLDAWIGLGLAYQQAGDRETARRGDPRSSWRQAEEKYSEAIRRRDDFTAARLNRGNVRLSLADWEAARGVDPGASLRKAVEDFSACIAMSPGEGSAWNNRALARLREGKWAAGRGGNPEDPFRKAIEDLDEAVRRNPAYVDALFNRALVRLSAGQWEFDRGGDPRPGIRAAVEDCSAALGVNPGFVAAWRTRGNLLLLAGQSASMRGEDPRESLDGAVAAFTEALQRAPTAGIHNNRGSAFIEKALDAAKRGEDPRENYEKAIADCDEALRLNPEQIEAFSNRGAARMRLAAALAKRGLDPGALFESAIRDLDEILKRMPNRWQAMSDRASCLESLGRFDEAASDYERAIALSGDQAGEQRKNLERVRKAAAAGAGKGK